MGRRQLHRGRSRRLEGSLCDVSVNRLLEICAHERVSGTLRIDSWGRHGLIGFDRGQVCDVAFHDLSGQRALDELVALRDGMFALKSTAAVSLDAPVPACAPAETAPAAAPAGVHGPPAPPAYPAETPRAGGAPALLAQGQTAHGDRPSEDSLWPLPALGGQAQGPSRPPSGQPGSQPIWQQRDWTPPQAQVGWPPQYAIVEPAVAEPATRRRAPTLTPAAAIGLFCLTVIFSVVATQL